MKTKWKLMYMDIAERIAKESHAVRLKVGAVFVSPDGIVSTGINGLPAGSSNECEDFINGQPVTKPEVSHAEENLFQKLMQAGVSTKYGSVFVTHAPCINCAKIIAGSGVTHLYFKNEYKNHDGLKWLVKNNLIVEKIDAV